MGWFFSQLLILVTTAGIINEKTTSPYRLEQLNIR